MQKRNNAKYKKQRRRKNRKQDKANYTIYIPHWLSTKPSRFSFTLTTIFSNKKHIAKGRISRKLLQKPKKEMNPTNKKKLYKKCTFFFLNSWKSTLGIPYFFSFLVVFFFFWKESEKKRSSSFECLCFFLTKCKCQCCLSSSKLID